MQKVFDTPKPVVLTIEIGAGSVRVQAAAGAETVVRVDGPRADEVTVEQRGDEIVVLARDADRGWSFLIGRAPIDVAVTAPAGSSLQAQTGSARVTVDGELGNARVRTGSGDLRVGELTGHGGLEAGSGVIEVGTVAGDLRLKAGSGDVTVARARGRLEANLGSGSIEVGFAGGVASLRSGSGDVRVRRAGSDIDAATGSGDVAIEDVRRGRIRATTASGDVRVGVAAGIPVWTDIRTISGEIRSELRGAGQPKAGQDHVEIHVTTVSGDVALRELSVGPGDRGAERDTTGETSADAGAGTTGETSADAGAGTTAGTSAGTSADAGAESGVGMAGDPGAVTIQ
jgi:DUF4097 and DUF4098 domain-containing protein YvlB